MQYLKQSTATTVTLGPFVDSVDAVSREVALTVTVKLSKNGAVLAARSDATTIAHDADGYYRVALNVTDTGIVGRLRVDALAAGALPVWEDYVVLAPAVYDVLFGTVAPSTHTVAAVWAAAPPGTPVDAIADAVWDGAPPGTPVGAIADAVWADADKVGYSLAPTGLDAIPMTLTSAPNNFRGWLVWLTLRFRKFDRNKTTGAIKVYGTDGTTVITTQSSTDTPTSQTTGSPT